MSPYSWLTDPEHTILRTPRGTQHCMPLFLPVFEPRTSPIGVQEMLGAGASGLIVNAFYLYRDRPTREAFLKEGRTLAAHLGLPEDHPHLLMTDSGAYQGFRQRVLLNNKKIVKFQNAMGVDIASPLDLVGHPGDRRQEARQKAEVTLKRIREALDHSPHSILAGVQQGGRFADLRRWCMEELLAMGVRYIAIGSLVPFFTSRHDIAFAFQVIREARELAGPTIPLHVFGSGDPLEMPFFAHFGGNVFDSSSFAHYARSGHYMTPYGALDGLDVLAAGEWRCVCPSCQENGAPAVLADSALLARHNLAVILETVKTVRRLAEEDALESHLAAVATLHEQWFPDSRLPAAWNSS